MKAYQITLCNCDGGLIGETWQQWFTLDKQAAIDKLKTLVDMANARELARTDDFCLRERAEAEKRGKPWWRLYEPDAIEGVDGWCVWAYSKMLFMREIEIE